MLDKVKIVNMHDNQQDLLIEELNVRDIEVSRKYLITNMNKLLIGNEHPDSKIDLIDKNYFSRTVYGN